MLQEFWDKPKETLGTGALGLLHVRRRASSLPPVQIARNTDTETPFVGNGLWVVPVTDPDGYRMELESPTDAPEEVELEE